MKPAPVGQEAPPGEEVIALALLVLGLAWWIMAAPRPEIKIAPQTSSSPWSAIAGATGAGAPTRCPIVAVELP